MTAADVAVVATGSANLASVVAALRRAGAVGRFVHSAREVRRSERLVLPGVGAFAAAMRRLREHELVEALRERIAARRPTLAICLGLQLLGRGSDESPDAAGLAVFAQRSVRFDVDRRVPHLGWNRVVAESDCGLLHGGHAYFAHSYHLQSAPPGWCAAWSDHGGRFVAALERGPVLACQFHPELSGDWGLDLLGRWLAAGGTRC